jgi:hypothetical protein
MRLTTIWSVPAMSFGERLRRTRDWSAAEFGRHLPKRIRYFVTMSEIGKATMKSPNIPATPLDYVLTHLDAPKSLS